MRKLCYLILFFTITSSSAIGAEPQTIYFPNDDYSSIQDTIDHASAGDTIIVRDGEYRENIIVDKSVIIRSENGPDNCIINYAYERESVFKVTANQVEISGFTVNGASEPWGAIWLYPSMGSTISGNVLPNNNKYAIRLDGSDNNTITGNSAQDSDYAHICLYHSDNNQITGNTCSNSDGTGAGIDLYDSSYNTVQQNTCSGNSKGIDIRADSQENTVIGNTFEGNSYGGIYLSGSNHNILQNTCNSNGIGIGMSGNNNLIMENTCNDNDSVGLILRSAIDNTISDNSFSNNKTDGILLNGLNVNNDIKNNICNENKGHGIAFCGLYRNDNTTMSKNTCSKNIGIGITVGWGNENIEILDNTCQENGKYGIYLHDPNNYIVTHNTVKSNKMDGIYLQWAKNNLISQNTCNDNNNTGIVLRYSSNNNTLKNNNSSFNNEHGIYLWDGDDNIVSDNTITGNAIFGIWNTGYNNLISGNRLDSNGEVAINNGKKLQLPMEEYNINTNISGNEILNSPIGVKTISSKQEDWQDILVDNTFSNVPKKFCQAWTLYVKATDIHGKPISGVFAVIFYKNGSLYKEGHTRQDGYLVADEFGFTPTEFCVEDNNSIVHDSPYTIKALVNNASISKEIILDDNKEVTLDFLNIDFSTSAQMNVCKENIDLDSLLLVTLYGKTTTTIDVRVTDYEGTGIGGTSVNLSTTLGYFATEGDKSKSVILITNGDGQVSANLVTENLDYTIGSIPNSIELSASIESGQTETLIIPIVDNLQEIKKYYYDYVPERQMHIYSGAQMNFDSACMQLVGAKDNPYDDWVCQSYQDTVLNLLDRIRLNDGSYLKYPQHYLLTEYYPRTDYLLNGLEYGPIQSLKAFHHAVIVYQSDAASWSNEGEVFDPWITQTAVIYKVWDWDLMMGHSIDIERQSHPAQYPLQGTDKYPRTIIGLGCKGFDPYISVLPFPDIPDKVDNPNLLKEKQAMGVVHCPVDILITDSLGLQTGILPDGTFVNESEYAIMAVFNISEDEKVYEFFMDFPNIARIDFIGTEEGEFTGQFLFNSSSHSLFDRYSKVPIANGETASLVIDETQSFPIILGNGTQIYPDETDPPATVTNLDDIDKSSSWILWQWDNPADEDFDHTLIYVNDRYKGKVTKPEHTYLAAGLTPDTEYTISVYSVDELDNMNTTEVNDTATTDEGMALNQGWNLFSPIIEPIDENTDRNISLKKGWNMFGYSSDTEFLWKNALVSDGGAPIPIEIAASVSAWLQSTIYYYDGNVYRPVPTYDDSLRKNKGYWLYAFKDDLTLILPDAGGSLIGNSHLWCDAQLENGTEIKTLQDAQQAGWLQGTIYYFDENSQYCKFIQADDYIYPWRGYWLWANANNLILTFAESTCDTSESADSFELQFYHYIGDDSGVRDLNITGDTFNAIGSGDPNVAKEGVDYKDGAQAPAVPIGDYVEAYTDPNIPGTRGITIDYRPLDANDPNLPNLYYPVDLIAYDHTFVGLKGTVYFNLVDANDLNDIPEEAMVYLRRLDESGSFVEWYNLRDSNNYSISWPVTFVQGLHARIELEILDKCFAANADGAGLVDFRDFAILAGDWEKTETNVRLAGDIDGNGEVNSEDLAIIAQHWLCSCD